DDRMAFVAVLRDEIIGVGRYDVTPEDPTTAEVACAVVDAHQGRGIGTELLQLLTSYVRTHGIDRFRAFLLQENRQMMRVFRNSGFELTRTLEEGMYTVDFPVEESEDSIAAWGERERRAVTASLGPIFVPRSVAVIGASTNPESIGNRLFRNL